MYNGGTNTFYLAAGAHPITIAHEEYGGGQNLYANVQGPAGTSLANNQNIPNSILTSAPATVTANNNVTLSAARRSNVEGATVAYLAP